MRKNYFSGLSKNTFLLTFTSFFADISTEMLYPILPIFLTQTLGASVGVVGLIEGIASATQNIVQGFSGFIADTIQKRKSVALFGYTLAAFSKPFMGFGTVWQAVLLGRFLDRLGTGTRSAPRDALIAESADEKNRGKAFGLEGIGDNAGAFVGPLLAILLLFVFHTAIRSIFFFAIIPGLLAVCMILLVKEHRVENTLQKTTFSLKNFPFSYWKYIVITVIFGLGNISSSFLILRAKNQGVSLLETIFFYACFNLTAALISYPAGFLSDKLGRKNLLIAGLIAALITFFGFAFSSNTLLVAVLFISYGMFQGIFRASGKALATDLTPPQLRASGIGWYATAVGLSGLIASIVGGQLWISLGAKTTFLYGGSFILLGILLLVIFLPTEKLHS